MDRLVTVQFSLSNRSAVPEEENLFREKETPEGLEKRSNPTGVGRQILQNVEKFNIAPIVPDLIAAGYQLVDAFAQERIHEKDPKMQRTYVMVRFVFSLNEYATPFEDFLAIRPRMMAVLQKMVDQAFWRARAYRNPFFEKGVEVANHHAISINLEARVPRFQGNGQPVVMWNKDEKGDRIGDAPEPISPQGELHFQNGMVKAVV